SADRSIESLAPEPGTDEQEQEPVIGQSEFCPRLCTQCGAPVRMEMLQVDAVVDHMQLFRSDVKAALDLAANHQGIADHGPQARMLEHLPLRIADISMVGIERDAETFHRSR